MIVLIGESGVGKTSTENVLIKRYDMKRGVSDTDRDMRPSDIPGVTYNFRTRDEMEALWASGKLVERVDYMGHIYGFVDSQCTPDRVVSVVPDGLRQLNQRKDLGIMSFYLKASPETRRARMLGRGDAIESVEKRLENDKIVFAGVEEMVDVVLENENDKTLEELADEIWKIYNARL